MGGDGAGYVMADYAEGPLWGLGEGRVWWRMMEGFDVAELFEVGAGAEDVGAVDDLVVVEMVVAAEDEVDEARGCLFG